ncbi:UDP-glucuronic acid decarboxylase family protein [Paraburkholderia solisilvae]|uniref:UDP-glucose 4-epimerase n=1 Tax=Paraburkholderia solisilvae TaxID=624376 RepID=A0A6J5DZV0_9BURK|nr:UDP-glucuronic acid decarboxylase family protein [Paraburkholderia solisilvae]CAB3759720.1 UDP-glucose 4-epimerase [Paraburkholderia solisilvae]
MTTRTLITGAAGLIGSHLCDRLVADGHDVTALDNFFTGSEKNIAHLLGNKRFRMVHHDVSLPLEIDRVDEIYNLACPASPGHYQRDPVQTVKSNVMGAVNMLDLARRMNATILQASTSEVYGDPTVHPQAESYCGNVNPIGPRACYDEGKRCAETLFFDYHRRYGTHIKVPRIFNTYGPRMSLNDGRVVSNFIVQALKDDDITIYGNGGQTRAFCYVDDLIDAFVLLMKTPADVTGPVNIGNPDEVSVKTLAECIVRMTGSRSRLVYTGLPADDPMQRCPDVSFARNIIGWVPKVSLEDGLARTIEHFRKTLSVRLSPIVEQPSVARMRAGSHATLRVCN